MNKIIKYHIADENEELIIRLKKGNMAAFKQIYERYWFNFYKYAYNIIREKEIAEEIIQEVFFSLWEKRDTLAITHSLEAYLFKAVRYQTLNFIRSKKIRTDYAASYVAFETATVDNSNEENIQVYDLKKHIEIEVSKLPDKCQQIFRMSRDEHLAIKTISDVLNLSHKTVENQLTKALKHLRSSLGDFLILIISIYLSA
ncbi:MAG: RNA polymerase sigma-70 factor [Sphingobacteriaceae bacterium]|nr:MAG: RNA polymerase sigma-70 factor [Sphingobacteriaceae bacterium]